MDPKLADLHRKLKHHKARRAELAKKGRWRLVKLEDREIVALQRKIARYESPVVKPSGRGGARRPQRFQPVRKSPAPKGRGLRRDPHALVLITRKNAAMLSKHYAELLENEPRLSPRRPIFRARLMQARSLLKLARKPAGAGGRAPPTSYKVPADQLREQAALQRRRAEAARRRKDYAAVQRHLELAARLEQQIDAQQRYPAGPPLPPARSPVPDGDLPFVPKEGSVQPEAEVEASEEGDESEAPPWYKRPLVLLLIAGAAGAAFALRGKKGKAAFMGGSAPGVKRKRLVFKGGTKSSGSAASAPLF